MGRQRNNQEGTRKGSDCYDGDSGVGGGSTCTAAGVVADGDECSVAGCFLSPCRAGCFVSHH